MKTLVLLRHGKSSWEHSSLRDFDRPLTPRGRGAAELMGDELRRRGLRFDVVLASPARRAADTLQLFEGAYAESLNVRFDEDVYAASWRTLLKIIQRTERKIGSLLIVGHNPGLQNLAVELLGRDEAGIASHFPTAAVATLRLPVKSWKEVQPRKGTLEMFLKPKEVMARSAA